MLSAATAIYSALRFIFLFSFFFFWLFLITKEQICYCQKKWGGEVWVGWDEDVVAFNYLKKKKKSFMVSFNMYF